MNLWTLYIKLCSDAHCPHPWVKPDDKNLGFRRTGICTSQMVSGGLALHGGEKGVRGHVSGGCPKF